MKQLFFGTGNPHKLAEIKGILDPKIQVSSFQDLPAKLEVEETESTLEGNAQLKAHAFFAHTGIPCFADDTGLEVPALQGAPGVYSARYAGPEGDAEANMRKLLQALSGVDHREAQFRTVVAFYDGSTTHLFEGILKGQIALEKSGAGGFGYDPIFIPEGDTLSLATYSPTAKNAISHRGIAIRKFAAFIETHI